MNFRDRGPGVKFVKDKTPLPDLFITIAIAVVVVTICLLLLIIPVLAQNSEAIL